MASEIPKRCPKCGSPVDLEKLDGEWLGVCTRSGELLEDCPGDRRSGKDRRAPQDGDET